jgi:hypothetical protein
MLAGNEGMVLRIWRVQLEHNIQTQFEMSWYLVLDAWEVI